MRNMNPKDKAVRVQSVLNGSTTQTVIYEGYGRTVKMVHNKEERGWYVDEVGPYKKAFAIEQCAALCKAGKP